MEDVVGFINMVSDWEAGDSPTSNLCFIVENRKDNLKAIFDAFIDCYDISIRRNGTAGMFCEVTLTKLRPDV